MTSAREVGPTDLRADAPVAVITGGARGIGAILTRQFADHGYRVFVADRDDLVTSVAGRLADAGADVTAIRADVTVKDDVDRLVATAVGAHGRIDVLVNNAAHARYGPALELSELDWTYTLANSLTSAFLCSQAAALHMVRARRGKIINISSASSTVVHTRTCAHAASKAGLEALTRVMAIELAPENVQVNAIAAGPIETERTHELLTPDEILARRRGVPAGRLGTGDDIASVALFLAGAEADWITGTTFAVDGGYSLAVKS